MLVTALTLQIHNITARERNTPLEDWEAQYRLPRAAQELRKRKNNKCNWWESKRTGRYQRLSDEEDEEEGPTMDNIRPRDIRAMRQLADERVLSLTRASASSANVSSAPVAEEVCPVVAETPLVSASTSAADDVGDDDDDDDDDVEVAEL